MEYYWSLVERDWNSEGEAPQLLFYSFLIALHVWFPFSLRLQNERSL